jgi:hypothetical protein
MKKIGGYSYDEFRRFPVGLRNWLYEKMIEEWKAEQDAKLKTGKYAADAPFSI